MLDGRDIIYVYDGSFDGFLSAVFEAFAHKHALQAIAVAHRLQPTFGAALITIETCEAKASRVLRGIAQKLGSDALETVKAGFLCADEAKATKLYRYLVYAFNVGKGVNSHLAHKDVLAVTRMARTVLNEANYTLEFLRFAQMENGVFFARIHPENGVVPLIMDHFAQRFNVQPFIIYDETHQIAGIFDMHEWVLAETDKLNLPAYAPGEAAYRQLWRAFYDAIAIKERINPNLRRSLMPKHFWLDMLEMNDSKLVENAQPALGFQVGSVIQAGMPQIEENHCS